MVRYRVDMAPSWTNAGQYAIYKKKWFRWHYVCGERYDSFERAVRRAKELKEKSEREGLPHEV